MKPVIRKVKWRKPSVGWLLSEDREEGQLFKALNNMAWCIVLGWKGRGERGVGGWLKQQSAAGMGAGRGSRILLGFFFFFLFNFIFISCCSFFLDSSSRTGFRNSLRRAILGGKKSALLSLKRSEFTCSTFKPLLKAWSSALQPSHCLRIMWQFERI